MPNRENFQSVRLSLVFGQFVVVNVTRVLPDTQRTLSIKELHEGMQKFGRCRKNWWRQDPQDQAASSKLADKAANSSRQTPLGPGHLGDPQKKRKKPQCRFKKNKHPGIPTTFVPTLSGDPDELTTKFAGALLARGFAPELTENMEEDPPSWTPAGSPSRGDGSFTYSVAMSISKGYEVTGTFEDRAPCTRQSAGRETQGHETESPSRASRMAERPLNWVHFTLLGNGCLPDMRVRLQTTEPISERLCAKAFGSEHISPIRWRAADSSSAPESAPAQGGTTQGMQCSWIEAAVPEFRKDLTDMDRRKVLHIRQHLPSREKVFLKDRRLATDIQLHVKARINRVREFGRGDGKDGKMDQTTPVDKAELIMEIEGNCLKLEGGGNFPYALARMILEEGLHVGEALKRQGVAVS